MKRAPRSITARLFSRPVVTACMWQGSYALLATLCICYGIWNSGESPNHARTLDHTANLQCRDVHVQDLNAKSAQRPTL